MKIKRMLNKVVAMALLLALVAGILPQRTIEAHAATTVTVSRVEEFTPYSGMLQFYYDAAGVPYGPYNAQSAYLFFLSDGRIGYCIEPSNPTSHGGTYYSQSWGFKSGRVYDSTAQTAIARALAYGAPNNGSNQLDHMKALALLIWDSACGYWNANGQQRTSSAPPFYSNLPAGSIKNEYDRLLGCLRQHGTIPSFSASSTGNITSSSTITLKPDGSGNYTATVTDSNQVLSNFNYSSSISGLTFTKNGNSLTITATAAAAEQLSSGAYAYSRGYDIPVNGSAVTVYAPESTVNSGTGQAFVVANQKYDPSPSTFKILVESKGKLTLTKASSDTTLTSGNDMYSLEGATYGVYSSQSNAANNTNAVGTLTVKADGSSNTLELTAGTYYVKETKAGKGYKLDPTIYEFSVQASSSNAAAQVLSVKDEPVNDPVNFIIRKTNGSAGNYVGPTEAAQLGLPTMKGTEFTIKYYDSATVSGDPTRIWTIAADSDYYVHLDNTHLVSGDALYFDSDGKVILPLGSFTIQETKAADGYIADATVYTGHVVLNSSGTDAQINWDNRPTIVTNLPDGTSQYDFPNMGIPKIETSAVDNKTQSHVSAVSSSVTIVDTVSYTNLQVGKSYTLNGQLMDAATGNALKDANGNDIKASANFTPTSVVGTVDVTFTFDSSALAGKTGVVFESLVLGGAEVASHKELADTDQTIYFPAIKTSAVDSTTGTQQAVVGDQISIIDTVTYENLVPGISYALSGTLMDKASGEAIVDADGKTVTAIQSFTPSSANGTVDVTFTFNSSNLAGKTLVVYESLSFGTTMLVEHKDLNDNAQTIYFPSIDTSAKDTVMGTRQARAVEGTIIEDTVSYTNLIVGKEYTVKGKIVDKATGNTMLDDNGDAITAETTFKAEATSGSVKVTYEFDATTLSGKTGVIFETLYIGDAEVVTHADINDVDQTIVFPAISTIALSDQTGTHQGVVSSRASLKDEVKVSNLLSSDEEYTLYGVLMEKESGLPLTDSQGKPITAIASFSGGATNVNSVLTFKLPYSYNAEELAGKTLVVFEYLYINYNESTGHGTLVAQHADWNDLNQTIENPAIATSARDSQTGTHTGVVAESVKVIDTVTYKNLIVGKSYTVSGVLMNKETGTPLTDDAGAEIVATKTFTAEKADGTVNLEYTLDSSLLAGKTVVVFEDLYMDYVKIVSHADLTDKEQTILYPSIGTSAIDGNTKDKVVAIGHETVIVDTVTYENLDPSQVYTLKGSLMDQATGNALKDANGDAITAEIQFQPEKSSGSVEVTFTFDGSNLSNVTATVFESLYENNTKVVSHEDINDVNQMVYIPEIKTNAEDKASDSHAGTITEEGKTTDIIDTVTYKNLIAGKTYTINGTLMNKATGEPLLDKDGNEIVASETFVAANAEGSIDLVYTLDTSLLAGETVVVFEDLIHNDIVVYSHADLEDEDQSIYFPAIDTLALDQTSPNGTGTHTGIVSEEATIIDTVSFKNLIIGQEYTLSGILMNQDSDEPMLDADGNKITSEKTFVADVRDGSVDMVYKLDSTIYQGETLVVYETLLVNESAVVSHTDIEDEEQTIRYPHIATQAIDKDTTDKVAVVGEITTLVDTVTYENLDPDQKYTLKAALMNKETGEILVDADGNEIRSTLDFTTEERDGSVEVTFTFNGTNLGNVTATVFETLYENDVEIVSHKDIEDEEQIVHFPEIKTNAIDQQSTTQAGVVTEEGEKTIIIDKVTYQNLIVGKKYTINGILMNKATGEPLLDKDNKEIVATTTFTATRKVGSANLVYELDSSLLSGETLIVFETLYHNGVEVYTHADLEDKEQAIYFPRVSTIALDATPATDDDLYNGATGTHTGVVTEKATIADIVEVENTSPGVTYTVKGMLMYQDTAEEVLSTETLKDFYTLTISAAAGKEFTLKGEALDLAGTTDENGFFIVSDMADGSYVLTIADSAVNLTITDGKLSYKPVEGIILSYGLVAQQKGNAITSEITFTAPEEGGTVTVVLPYVLDSTKQMDRAIVVYEKLYVFDTLVAKHEDIDDEEQTVYYPSMQTTALDEATQSHTAQLGEEIVIIDTIEYTNLSTDEVYSLEGTLMNKETGEPILDKDGKPIKGVLLVDEDVKEEENENEDNLPGESDTNDPSDDVITDGTDSTDTPVGDDQNDTTVPSDDESVSPETPVNQFTPETSTGSVQMKFVLDTSLLAGETIVVFEVLYENDIVVLRHEDINDENQSVSVVDIATHAHDKETGSHEGSLTEEQIIVDEVECKNLVVGQKYRIEGALINKTDSTEDEIVYLLDENGDKIFGTLVDKEGKAFENNEFVAKESDCTLYLEYKVDSRNLRGKTVVVFEDLYIEDILVASHADIEDANQTIHYPLISTVATDKTSGTHQGTITGNEATIIDTVTYYQLQPGEYLLEGTLMDQKTGKAILGADDEPIMAYTTFTIRDEALESGDVQVTFTVPREAVEGKTVTVFEDLLRNGELISYHRDINDAEQTVDFPGVKTVAQDGLTEDPEHQGALNATNTIIDTVTCTNLRIDTEYTLKGILMNKATGKAVLDKEGKEITAETKFKADAVDMLIEMTFKVDSSLLAGTTVVVFEDLYVEELLVDSHADLEDEDQSIIYPSIETTATVNGEKEVNQGSRTTIVDTVSYTNLIVGKEYTVKGALMDKATGKILKIGEHEIKGETTFVAEATNGTVEMSFIIDTSSFTKDMDLVVFEDIYLDEVLIASHADLEDQEQTVTIKYIEDVPTGDTMLPYAAGVVFVLATAGVVFFYRKRKEEISE